MRSAMILRPWLRRLRDMRAFAVVFTAGFVAGLAIHDPDLATTLMKVLIQRFIG